MKGLSIERITMMEAKLRHSPGQAEMMTGKAFIFVTSYIKDIGRVEITNGSVSSTVSTCPKNFLS